MLLLTKLSQFFNQMALAAVLPQFWALPFLLWLRFVNASAVSKWTTWLVMTFFLGGPYAHPIQVGWVSRNANTVRSRAIGAAMYNMCVQGSVRLTPFVGSATDKSGLSEAVSSRPTSTSRMMHLRTTAATVFCWRLRCSTL